MADWLYTLTPPRPTFADDATEEEAAIMRDHFAYLQRLLRDGTLVLAGPSLDPLFGIAVFQAQDEAAARRLMDADPAVASGLQQARLSPFRVSLLRGRDG
jgi:uncharacterized protein YciI